MRRPMIFAFAAAMICSVIVLPASSLRAVEIEGVQSASAELINVLAYLQRPSESSPLLYEGFYYVPIWAYLDTGASGIVLSKETAEMLGVVKSMHNGELVKYEDVGVSGSATFHVSESLYVGMDRMSWEGLLEPNWTTYPYKAGPFRAQIATEPADETLGAIDVIGMPAMVGKVTVIDPKPLEDPENMDFSRAFIYNPGTPFNPGNPLAPGIPSTNRHVKLSYGTFDQFTTVTPSGATGPTMAHNPFIGPDPVTTMNGGTDNTPGITIAYGGLSATGSFLLDTGAQMSAISTALANQLNVRYVAGSLDAGNPRLELFDPLHPELPGTELLNQFQATVGGIGGSSTVAGFYLTKLGVPLMEGDSLDFLSAPVLVHDISLLDPNTNDVLTLDGIFGLNFLIASMDPETWDVRAGAFNWIVFDEPNGILGLDVKGLDPVPEPATWALLLAAAVALAARRTLRRKLIG
jgi:hypothetical protein